MQLPRDLSRGPQAKRHLQEVAERACRGLQLQGQGQLGTSASRASNACKMCRRIRSTSCFAYDFCTPTCVLGLSSAHLGVKPEDQVPFLTQEDRSSHAKGHTCAKWLKMSEATAAGNLARSAQPAFPHTMPCRPCYAPARIYMVYIGVLG